jgi:hypothetical protein
MTVAHRVYRAPFLTAGVDVCRHNLEHDDVVPIDEVNDSALDISKALADQRRPDFTGAHWRKFELSEFVGIGARTGPDADHRIQHVDRRNCDYAFLGVLQGREGMIPWACGDGEHWCKVEYHGPRNGHDVIRACTAGRHEDHRPRLDESEGPFQLHVAHEGNSRKNVAGAKW